MTGGAVKVPGRELTLLGTTYVVPPLNAAAVKQYREALGTFMSQGAIPDIEMVCNLLHAALRRNYPDIPMTVVEEAVDYGNLVDIMDVVMNTSGLVASMGNLARRIQAAMDPAATSTS